MPKQELDNTVRADLDVRIRLDQRCDAIKNTLKDAATNQAKQQQDLQANQSSAVGNSAIAGDQKVATILANQRDQLESTQRSQVDLMNQALAAAGRMEKAGPDGPRQALQLINDAADLNGRIAESGSQQRLAELDELKAISVINNAGQRNERTEDLFRSQQDAAGLLNRDMAVATAAFERRESLMEITLNKDQVDRLRTIVEEKTGNEKLRAVLTDEAMQRLADEALHPGQERLEDVNEGAAIQRVKGELAERIAAADALKEIEQENKTRAAERQLFLIEGNRIRDEKGKKMSDGLIVWRDAENNLQIWKALEVKSGPHAARDLNYKVEKLTQEQDKELRNYALDVARDAVEEQKGLTTAQRQVEIERLAKEEEADLRSRAVQKEGGQREQTKERIDLTERIHIDGRAYQASVDRDRRLNDIVQKIATDDAIKNDLDVKRLDVSSRELQSVAKAFVEELLRQRETA